MYRCKQCNFVFDKPKIKTESVPCLDDWHNGYWDLMKFEMCPECESKYIEEIEED